MLDTATAVKFYLTIDDIVMKDAALANYFNHLDIHNCISESEFVLDMGVKLNRKLLIMDDVDEREKEKTVLIKLSIDNVYKTFFNKAVAEPTVRDMQNYNLPSDSHIGYAASIYYVHNDYNAKAVALHDVLTPNRFWHLRKLYILPPNEIQPSYTWYPK